MVASVPLLIYPLLSTDLPHGLTILNHIVIFCNFLVNHILCILFIGFRIHFVCSVRYVVNSIILSAKALRTCLLYTSLGPVFYLQPTLFFGGGGPAAHRAVGGLPYGRLSRRGGRHFLPPRTGGKMCIRDSFSAITEYSGVPVYSLFTRGDIPDYTTCPFHECAQCREGRKIDALVNSCLLYTSRCV